MLLWLRHRVPLAFRILTLVRLISAIDLAPIFGIQLLELCYEILGRRPRRQSCADCLQLLCFLQNNLAFWRMLSSHRPPPLGAESITRRVLPFCWPLGRTSRSMPHLPCNPQHTPAQQEISQPITTYKLLRWS